MTKRRTTSRKKSAARTDKNETTSTSRSKTAKPETDSLTAVQVEEPAPAATGKSAKSGTSARKTTRKSATAKGNAAKGNSQNSVLAADSGNGNFAWERVEAISQRIEDLTQSLDNVSVVDCECYGAKDQIRELETRLATMKKSMKSQAEKLDKLDSGLQLLHGFGNQLETVTEQLNALRQKLDQRSADSVDPSKQIAQLGKDLGGQLESLRDSGKSNSQKASSKQLDQLVRKVESLQKTLEKREATPTDHANQFEQLVARIDALQAAIESQTESSEGGGDTGQAEQLSAKLDWVTQLLEEKNASPGKSGESSDDYGYQFELLNQRLDDTQNRISALVESINPLVASLENCNDAPEEDEEEPESEWERQKRELLENYGETSDAPNSRPAKAKTPTKPASTATVTKEQTSVAMAPTGSTNLKKELSEFDNFPNNDPDLVELRNKLEEKLRRAEIEISIERAKFHRERHQLEQGQADLERRLARIKSKSENDGKENKGRWSRFLGGKRDE